MRKHDQKTAVYIDSHGRRIKLLVFQPKKAGDPDKTPGVLWIHGGGFSTGNADTFYITRAHALVRKYGAVLVMPNYTLSRKAPYPAALEDCYAALLYLRDHAEELGCSTERIMVGGESAGGGLTASLCMLARDRGEVDIAFQMPLYPMLDDRDTDSSRNNHAPVWNTRRNHAAWKQYLRGLQGETPPYAAAARQTDYHGLPPAYTFVGDIEPFYRETLTYIENLQKAGVPAKVDVYPGWFHAYDLFFPFTKKGKRAIRKFEQEYLYAAKHYSKKHL